MNKDIDGKTLKEIGAELGVTCNRVMQIEQRALGQIRLSIKKIKTSTFGFFALDFVVARSCRSVLPCSVLTRARARYNGANVQ